MILMDKFQVCLSGSSPIGLALNEDSVVLRALDRPGRLVFALVRPAVPLGKERRHPIDPFPAAVTMQSVALHSHYQPDRDGDRQQRQERPKPRTAARSRIFIFIRHFSIPFVDMFIHFSNGLSLRLDYDLRL
jgi:hypothetical protein